MTDEAMIEVLSRAFLAGFHAAKMNQDGESRQELAAEYAKKEVEEHYDQWDKYWS